MRKCWVIYTICSSVLVSCSFVQYKLGGNTENEKKDIIIVGHTIGKAPDFKSIKQTSERKKTFFSYLIPGIEYENSLILKERHQILLSKEKSQRRTFDSHELMYLKKLAKKYRVNWYEPSELNDQWFDELLIKIDVLPVPLVVIQAANESAWGTSRFAQQGNNYFGQWCYKQGCGIVPLHRSEGKAHEVAKFSTVQQSIHHYFLNVNRNKAYKKLREIRAQRRALNKTMVAEDAAFDLTTGLIHYSERGQHYIDSLQLMLKHNRKYWRIAEETLEK